MLKRKQFKIDIDVRSRVDIQDLSNIIDFKICNQKNAPDIPYDILWTITDELESYV